MKDAVGFCNAGRELGMSSAFTDKVAAMVSEAARPQHFERDFLRFARKDLNVDFQVYVVDTIVRSRGRVAITLPVGLLLPHEVCHWLWHFNRAESAVYAPACPPVIVLLELAKRCRTVPWDNPRSR